jgi:hypothetical protein
MLERFDVLCRRCPARKEYEKAAIGEGRIFKRSFKGAKFDQPNRHANQQPRYWNSALISPGYRYEIYP